MIISNENLIAAIDQLLDASYLIKYDTGASSVTSSSKSLTGEAPGASVI